MGRLLLLVALAVWVVLLARYAARLLGARKRPEPPSGARNGAHRSPYDVLGIPPGASAEEISAAYRRLVQMYHPDKVASMAPEFRELAEERMKEINAAYDRLKRLSS